MERGLFILYSKGHKKAPDDRGLKSYLVIAAAAVHAQQADDVQEDVDEVQIQGQCAVDGSLLGQLCVACIVGVDLAELLGIVGGEQHEHHQADAAVEHRGTDSDELNILAGLMAKKMGTRHTIARVRNPDYSSQRDFMRNQLGFSMIVNPELEAASEIRRVLSFPSAVKVDTFSRGKVELAEFFVEDHSRLNGVELNQLHKITKTNILICAVSHNEDVIIPDGNYAIKPGDHLYITGTHRDLSRFCLDIGAITNRIKNVIIIGGGKIAYYLSKQLSTQGIKVKIIEKDKNRCQVLAEKLPYVTIIHGDGSDDELLNEEGIENTDAVLALTGLDEENIVLSLSAKSLYHKKTIAKVIRMNYIGLSDVFKVDSIVAPKKIVASQIIRYVRAKMTKDHDSAVKTLYKIVDGEVEAVEFKVTEHFNYLQQQDLWLLIIVNGHYFHK